MDKPLLGSGVQGGNLGRYVSGWKTLLYAHGGNGRKKDVGFYRKFLIWRLTGERFESNDPPGQNTKFLTKVL